MRGAASLRVSEGLPTDIGTGVARIDRAASEQLRVGVGNLIEVIGHRPMTAIVTRARPEDDGKRSIRLEPTIQRNAKVRNGGWVHVRRVDPPIAESIVIAPVCPGNVHFDWGFGFQSFMSKAIYYRPFAEGDIFVTAGVFLQAHALPFVVVNTRPNGTVQVGPTTTVTVEGEAVPESPSRRGRTASSRRSVRGLV